MTNPASQATWKARAGPVAIVGIGCRFPGGAKDADSFWRLLSEGRDTITEIPQNRIDIGHYFDPEPATPGRMMTRWGGFLDHIDEFDAAFFRISPREAERMDPQQRLLLETAWEAFEDAGQDLTRLRGTRAGVFIGQWLSDFEGRLFGDPEAVDFQMTTGSGRYASSGRISYAFGLNGPSLTLDTACSSSLVAVHLAVRAIRSGECDVAVAGGVNVILQPHISIAYSQSRMMAADGRCKFGDANADGYVRSEGVGLVVLKALDRARADNDRIYAVIHGSATNNDGCSSGSMGTPSQSGQEDLLRAAYADAGRPIDGVDYLEAHGTGTRVGDPVEFGAIAAVIREGDTVDTPVYVGSVKTNIGHTEGAAGIAGLIKVALALHHGTIPPSLHCDQLNPAIAWDGFPCALARSASPWPARNGGRLAGVSAFGISGSNAHVVLGEAPQDDVITPSADTGRTTTGRATHVLPLSARSAAALRQLAGDYRALLASDHSSLPDVCWSAATRRTPQDYRMAFVAADAAGMVEALRRFVDDTTDIVPVADDPPKVAFVVPGQGGQWVGMARELMRCEPVFLAALTQCDAAARSLVDWSIVEQIVAEPGTDVFQLDRIDVIQPVLVAIAIAYAALWRSLGVEPDAVVGHSMGEVGAACISGALDLASAMRVVCLRSKLMRRTSGHGAMALVDLPMDEVTKRLAGREDKVSIAAANGPRSVVISGEPETVTALLAQFERDNVFSRLINVDVASHSPQMQPLADELAAGLAGMATQPARIPFYSTVFGRRADGEELAADYWARNIRQPVLFGATMQQLLADGITTVIELGPHPILLHSVQDVAQSLDRRVTTIGSGRREEPEQSSLLAGFGQLWAAGHPVAWQRLMPEGGRSVTLPRHPWNRARYWGEAAEMRAASADPASRPVMLDDATRAWLHRLQWIEAAPSMRVPSEDTDNARWLIACDDAGFTSALATQIAPESAAVSITTLAHIETAIAALAAGDAPVGIVLVLADDTEAGYLPLQLLQAVDSGHLRARIWIVSRGAQAVDAQVVADERVSSNQAAAWGAARVVAQEYPDLWGGLIDLDPSQAPSAAAPLLAMHLLHPDDEDQIAFRDGRRFVLRVVPDSDREIRIAPYAWRRDVAYLVTGGLGEVGLQIAKAMASAGARRLILMSRTPLPPRETWSALSSDDAMGRRVVAIRALEQLGVAVHVAAVDVGDEPELRAFLARYEAEGWPRIGGVVHAAGLFDNHLAGTMTRAQFDAAMAPKLHGAQHLDALLPDVDLFVMFSSTGAFQVQPGQANYAAANAGLNALARDRRARGLPAQSIAWGVWENTGLVNNEAGRLNVAEMARQGIGSFAPERGAALFGWLCARDVACPVVLPVDWAVFKAHHRSSGDPLYRAVVGGACAAAAADLPQQLLVADAAERKRLLDAVVRDAIGKVLKLPPAELDPRRTLGTMGLNSLMAIELRNRLEAALGKSLSATLAWNHPTVAALVAHLSGGGETAPAEPQRTVVPLPERVTNLAELSDEEALAALRA
jgi:acyl transferase domain-containing protein